MADRLPRLRPDQLDAEQLAVYRAITEGPRAAGPQAFRLTDDDGALTGPFNALLYSPAVGAAVQGLGAALRYATALSARARELVILTVAAHWDSAFERHAHEAVGRQVGLTEDELRAIRERADVPLADAAERTAVSVARALLADGRLTDDEYADAVDVLAERGLVEVSALIGYYGLLALQLRLFDVGAP